MQHRETHEASSSAGKTTCTRLAKYAILRVANVMIVITDTRKAPKLHLGGFSVPLLQVGLIPRLIAIASLIEPFADAIGNYTSHDGEDKHNHAHRSASFPCRSGDGNEQSIA